MTNTKSGPQTTGIRGVGSDSPTSDPASLSPVADGDDYLNMQTKVNFF